jgi:hypothetical protein
VRKRTPAADEELRCMSNHLVNKALLPPIEPGVWRTDASKQSIQQKLVDSKASSSTCPTG